MDGHFSEDANGRSFYQDADRPSFFKNADGLYTVHCTLYGHVHSWTLMDAHRRWVDDGWTLGGRLPDAQPKFEDAGKNLSRDGNAMVTDTLPNHKKDSKYFRAHSNA